MDPGNGRKSAYTSRICKALRCITAASSSALLTNSPRSPTSERAPHPPPSSFPPPPSPPPCLRIRPRRHERRHGGQVRLQPAQLGPSADAGRAGVHSPTNQTPGAWACSVCPVWCHSVHNLHPAFLLRVLSTDQSSILLIDDTYFRLSTQSTACQPACPAL
ncbi:hypothetical protein BD311DRAFT_747188, partial [Dichomitus squalens]